MYQVTAVFVVPDTATANGKGSAARMFAEGGDTTTLIEDGGGGGGCLVLRAVPAQPATDIAAQTIPRWSTLRITNFRTHREPLNACF